ncbi:MAG: YbaB/EbfC family nucleoid-associated protein [Candidatus Eisenbacteria bacterium]|nr:YbaB/EbfC family nucleoid-associated protein [Candidatus Eisenbacteria bacterium]
MAKNLQKMLKEAQKLEKRVAEVRASLADMKVEGTAGGGAVSVTMNGQRDVLGVSIDPSVIEDGDASMLEDLLVSALRDAKERSDKLAAEEMSKVTGMAIPPGTM